jgi:hypothetical protein
MQTNDGENKWHQMRENCLLTYPADLEHFIMERCVGKKEYLFTIIEISALRQCLKSKISV